MDVGIPACKNCLSLLLTNASPINVPQCSECVKWNTSAKSGLLDFDPPQDYPQDLIPLSGKLSCKKYLKAQCDTEGDKIFPLLVATFPQQ